MQVMQTTGAQMDHGHRISSACSEAGEAQCLACHQQRLLLSLLLLRPIKGSAVALASMPHRPSRLQHSDNFFPIQRALKFLTQSVASACICATLLFRYSPAHANAKGSRFRLRLGDKCRCCSAIASCIICWSVLCTSLTSFGLGSSHWLLSERPILDHFFVCDRGVEVLQDVFPRMRECNFNTLGAPSKLAKLAKLSRTLPPDVLHVPLLVTHIVVPKVLRDLTPLPRPCADDVALGSGFGKNVNNIVRKSGSDGEQVAESKRIVVCGTVRKRGPNVA